MNELFELLDKIQEKDIISKRKICSLEFSELNSLFIDPIRTSIVNYRLIEEPENSRFSFLC